MRENLSLHNDGGDALINVSDKRYFNVLGVFRGFLPLKCQLIGYPIDLNTTYRISDIGKPIIWFARGEKIMCGAHCGRHFLTAEEKIEHFEKYKEWLEMETKGVDEAITTLKKAS